MQLGSHRRSVAGVAASDPGRVAVVDGDRAVTFEELDRRANGAAVRLAELGVAPGDPVGMRLGNRAEWFIASHAIARLGAMFVPISPRLTPKRPPTSPRTRGWRCASSRGPAGSRPTGWPSSTWRSRASPRRPTSRPEKTSSTPPPPSWATPRAPPAAPRPSSGRPRPPPPRPPPRSWPPSGGTGRTPSSWSADPSTTRPPAPTPSTHCGRAAGWSSRRGSQASGACRSSPSTG